MKNNMKVINGNNIDILKQYPDNYFDAIVTDPPYGLGKEPNAEALMKDWIEKGYHEITGTGFMGKEWDAFIPQPIFWKEVFRVLKHGGHVLSFFGTRTYDWGVMSMRFAGFEVRDCIQWLYGSGFPKSHNISKAIDKMYGAEREVIGKSDYTMPKADNSMSENSYGISGGKLANGNTAERITAEITAPSTEQAKEWDGWGSALKPANEPIVLARKPLEKGLTIAENVLKWGTGAINIDGCRVSLNDKENYENNCNRTNVKSHWGNSNSFSVVEANSQGRFPANIILTHHEDCECIGTKNSKGMFGDGTSDNIGGGFTDANGEETVEDWNCVDDCPIKILDEQSGESKSQKSERGNIIDNNVFGKFKPQENTLRGHSDKGGASRFFYVAKASKSERNKGLDGFDEKTSGSLNFRNPSSSGRSEDAPSVENMGGISKPKTNFHPTVKPIKLMQYLVRLITPPNGIVLDPFCGSGTTGVACKLEGFQFVGLEQDAEYSKIAQARIDNYVEEKPTIKKNIKTEVKSNQIDIFNNEL
jgi:site-specific DNA-methyltransferase (adenine-specific)